MALPFFEVGNMSSSFGGFNFHQVRSKKSVATAVSFRDSQGGVRNWLVETRGWVGNSQRKRLTISSRVKFRRLEVICIYIYVLYMDSWIVMSGWSSRLCCYFSGDNGYCVIQDQGTTWGTIEYSSSLEFLLGALYSCNIPVKF